MNAEAVRRGLDKPLFFEGDEEDWKEVQSGPPRNRTEVEKSYKFAIPEGSIGKDENDQVWIYKDAAPLGVDVLAEVCERLLTLE